MFFIGARSEIFVPESVEYSHDSESRGDYHEALIGECGSLRRDVFVLAPFEHAFMNTVQADGIRIGLT